MLSRDIIIEVIRDSQEKRLPDLIERDLEVPLELKIRRAVSIIGPRRAGKTYYMFLLMNHLLRRGVDGNRILYVSFEDYRLEGIGWRDFRNIIDCLLYTSPSPRDS